MNGDMVNPETYSPQDKLYAWILVDPANPRLVGELKLSQLVSDCATFTYAPEWWNFPLSEDLPIIAGQEFSAGLRGSAPGALDDARPDRWGERIIRHVERPARLSVLEMLLFAGDDRFGALGISVSAEHYIPRAFGPYPGLADLQQLAQAIEEVQSRGTITPEIQRLVRPGATLGGARPKALFQTDDGPCVIKFSEIDDPVDTPLIEHASMTLAAHAGIEVPATAVLALPPRFSKKRHALTIKRFDRVDGLRLHCLSAKTVLAATGLKESYGALATILLRLGSPDRHSAMREELFKRMVFNILMDNTDDHERNHCVRLDLDGYYALSPAFDVVPAMQNLGYQAMSVGAGGAESTLENALSELSEFGIRRPRAIELIQLVARTVDQWIPHFEQGGVCPADMELLSASIDRDWLKAQRKEFC
jgi:serine/threonine-protein kinase HipA